MTRYYIKTSLNFPMSLEKQARLVKRSGATNPRKCNYNNMPNVPQVLTFSALSNPLQSIKDELPMGYTVHVKDW